MLSVKEMSSSTAPGQLRTELSRETPPALLWLQKELVFSPTAASEVYVSFGRKAELERMFMKTILHSPDKNITSSSDTRQFWESLITVCIVSCYERT